MNATFIYLPGVASFASAATAAALTELLGQYVDDACASPGSARPLTVAELMKSLKSKIALNRSAANAA